MTAKHEIIFLLSVQHTGTWFLIDAVRNHPDVGQFVELKDLTVNKSELTASRVLVQTHLSTYGSDNTRGSDAFHPTERQLNVRCVQLLIDAMVNTYKTIIPVRDPVKSLMTRIARHPELDVDYLVSGFRYLAELEKADSAGKVFFFPIDTELTRKDRRQLLASMFDYLRLSEPDYAMSLAHKWAAPKYNISKSTSMKKHYASGNREAMKELMIAKPRETKALIGDDLIKEFLFNLGYRDLMWWG